MRKTKDLSLDANECVLSELVVFLLQTAIEHHLVPRIMVYILPYIRDRERDERIHQQCDEFANITLEQLG